MAKGPNYVLRLWPAMVYAQLAAGGRTDPFHDHTVQDALTVVRGVRAAVARQAAPPSRTLWQALVQAVNRADLASALRVVAAAMTLQTEAVQRPGVIAALRVKHLVRVPPMGLVLHRAHKTQDAEEKKAGKVEPTPVFAAPCARAAIDTLQACGVLPTNPESLLFPNLYPLRKYEQAIQQLWALLGVPADLAARMTAHGFRRLGADMFLSAGGTLEDLMQLAPWGSLSAAQPYLPEWYVQRLGLQRFKGGGRCARSGGGTEEE